MKSVHGVSARVLLVSASIVVAALSLSGCADPGTESAVRSTTPSAPPPSAEGEFGAIAGRVVDEELVPVAGADVAIRPGTATARTDAAGAFTLNDLEPGSYAIHVSALGYQAHQSKAEVAAGAVANVTIELEAIPLAQEPYTALRTGRAFLNLGVIDASYLSGLKPVLCAPCDIYFVVDKAPMEVSLEPLWQKSVGAPGVADKHAFAVRANPTNSSLAEGGENMGDVDLANREKHVFSEESVKPLVKHEKVLVFVHKHGTDVSIMQRVDVYMAFAYHAALPADFTSLPPA